jgi:histidinol dehydrogenase
MQEEVVETMPGVSCWRKSVAIDKVGLYIPGGTAPLFSTVLMLGVPAVLAGCREIVLCSPPDRQGKLHPAILYTAHLIGISKIFRVGGVQAIGAMALGTESIPQVYKIFGPGNQYVTAAKQWVSRQGTAIDMPAGPSEVLVCADDTADPEFVAADLLSQAEHGIDSQVVLVAFAKKQIEAIQEALERQLTDLPRAEIARKALENSVAIVVTDRAEALDMINEYAPEHLILSVIDVDDFADGIVNAGSVFMGNYTPESVGDYASGTNHTLPTNGFARAYSGVSLDSFVKKITFQRLTEDGLRTLGPAVEVMAEAEELRAHKLAVTRRLDRLNN